MNKKEFIKMASLDAGIDETLKVIVSLFEEIIPSNADVDSTKNPHDFYNVMRDYASQHKTSSSYCINPELAKKLAIEYLNISVKEKESSTINLEDFF